MASFMPRVFEEAAKTDSGFKLSLSEARGSAKQHFRLSISKAAQEKHFGGALADRSTISLMLDDDPGKTHLLGIARQENPAASNAFIVTVSGKYGIAHAKLTPWCQVADGKRPPVAMDVVADVGGNVMVKLPVWAKVPARKVGQGKPVMGD